MKVFSLEKLKAPLSSFWVLQLIGWAVYGVLIFITFLTVVPPSGRFGFLQVKKSRAVTVFLLPFLMRPIYKHIGSPRSVPFIALLIVITSFAYGSLWPFGEHTGLWLMN